MTITVTEKEHWKERISRKVEQAIDALLSREDPSYLERIRKEARVKAYESLGIAELRVRLDELDNQAELAKKERERIYTQMMARVTGLPAERQRSHWYSEPHEVTRALERRERTAKQELMAKDDLGRKLLALQREQEELLDTVWLATSGKQIKELWQNASALLEQDPTPLQSKALEIEPDDVTQR